MTQQQETTAIPAVVAPSTTLATPVALPAGIANTDIGKQLVGVLDDMRGSLSSVRDAAYAQTALPKLQDIAGRFDKLSATANGLSPDARRAVSTYVGSQQSVFKNLMGSVMALPGVSGILKTVLDQIQGRIDGLAKV